MFRHPYSLKYTFSWQSVKSWCILKLFKCLSTAFKCVFFCGWTYACVISTFVHVRVNKQYVRIYEKSFVFTDFLNNVWRVVRILASWPFDVVCHYVQHHKFAYQCIAILKWTDTGWTWASRKFHIKGPMIMAWVNLEWCIRGRANCKYHILKSV